MTYKQAIKHYKTAALMGAKFGWSSARIHNWKLADRIPEAAQLKIERDTGGKLKSDV